MSCFKYDGHATDGDGFHQTVALVEDSSTEASDQFFIGGGGSVLCIRHKSLYTREKCEKPWVGRHGG